MKERNYKESDSSFMIDVPTACERYQLGVNKIRAVAKEAGALVKVGKLVRIIPKKMDEYLLKQTGD